MSRLSYGPQRPLPHDTTHATGGADELTPADIGAAASSHTHASGDVTGLATVATSGSYSDLSGTPTIPSTPGEVGAAAAVHTHASTDVTDFGTAAAAAAPVQSVNGDTGVVVLAASDVGAVPASSYTAKGTVLAASAASTPAAIGGAAEGLHLVQRGEYAAGARWAKGLGYNARLVTTTSGPFDLTDGDAVAFNWDGTVVYTLTITIADVSSIDAVTPAEVVAKVTADNNASVGARVRDDGKVEFYAKTNGRDPTRQIRIDLISATMATAFGLSTSSYSFGSGGSPSTLTTTNTETFTFAGTETLTVITESGTLTSDVFQVTDTTAALVTDRINNTVAFQTASISASYSSGVVTLYGPALDASFMQVTATGGANAILGFPATAAYGDSGAFDAELLGEVGSIPEIVVFVQTVVTRLTGITSGSGTGAQVIDLEAGACQNLTLTGNSTFTVSNASAERSYSVSAYLTASGGAWTLGFDADWKWIGSKPSSMASGETGLLLLTNRGSADTDIVASWQILGSG